ncbi:MAG: relaxase/mobilization nuclease domain-containing protein [Steroidobacteraceae bacterium]
MVKMLNQGGTGLGAVGRHINYLDRDGELEIHTDEGERLKGKGADEMLIDDWDLDLEEKRRTAELKPRTMGKPPKLVHKILFSMPAGTPPQKVLAAVKGFAREEFGAKQRYAMVLHTDEPHPHVHMVVKAMGHDGKRLNIRRDTLRYWRQEFARHLREQGIAANATDRRVRGEVKPQKTDGIHRAAMRGASTHWRQRTVAVARELNRRDVEPEPGKARLLETRQEVLRGWRAVGDQLVMQNQLELAQTVRGFVARMPAVQTEAEWIRSQLLERQRVREGPELSR